MQNYKIRPVDRLNMFVNFNGEVYVNSDEDNPFDSEIVFMFDPKCLIQTYISLIYLKKKQLSI